MYADFKLTLAAVRTNADMSQAQWASALGVDKGTVYNWEKGKGEPSASMLRKISELSGIPMDYIFVPDKSDKIGLAK